MSVLSITGQELLDIVHKDVDDFSLDAGYYITDSSSVSYTHLRAHET